LLSRRERVWVVAMGASKSFGRPRYALTELPELDYRDRPRHGPNYPDLLMTVRLDLARVRGQHGGRRGRRRPR
jgi:hypothetical protein